ncbi:hypothetical protein Vretifemale_3990, partial [Volvox reticuliferus]
LRHAAGSLGSAGSGAVRWVRAWRRRRPAESADTRQQAGGDDRGRSAGDRVSNGSSEAGAPSSAPRGFVSISSGSSRYKATGRSQLVSDVKVAAAVALMVCSVMLPWMRRGLKRESVQPPPPGGATQGAERAHGSAAAAAGTSLPPPVALPPAQPSEYPRVP